MGTRDKNIPLMCRGHSRPVRQVQHSGLTPDGFFLISAGLDGKAILCEGITGDWVGTFEGHNGAVFSAVMNDAVTLAATASADFTACVNVLSHLPFSSSALPEARSQDAVFTIACRKVWNAVDGDELLSFAHKHVVKAVSFLQSDRKLATGGLEKKIRIFDLERPDAEPDMMKEVEGIDRVNSIVTISDNVLWSIDEKTVRVWDARTMEQTSSFTPSASAITTMAHTRNRSLVSLAYDRTVEFRDPLTYVYHCGIHAFSARKRCVVEHPAAEALSSAALHPTEDLVVAGGRNFYVYKYDLKTGEQLEEHKGHHGPVHCVSYAPDGDTYASSSEDGTVRIWQHEVKEYGLWKYSAPLTRSDTPVVAPEGTSITVERKRTAPGKAVTNEGSDSSATGGKSPEEEESTAPGATAVADGAVPPVGDKGTPNQE